MNKTNINNIILETSTITEIVLSINAIITIEPIKIKGTLINNRINIETLISKLLTSLIILFTVEEVPIIFKSIEDIFWICENSASLKDLLYLCDVIEAIYWHMQANIRPNIAKKDSKIEYKIRMPEEKEL